jgi:hypothetical protein
MGRSPKGQGNPEITLLQTAGRWRSALENGSIIENLMWIYKRILFLHW